MTTLRTTTLALLAGLATANLAEGARADGFEDWWRGVTGQSNRDRQDRDDYDRWMNPDRAQRQHERREDEYFREHPEAWESMNPVEKDRLRRERQGVPDPSGR